MICNKNICAHHIFVSVILFIVVYGYGVKEYFKNDILEYKFGSCSGCDIWALSHFAMYLIIAYNFPSHYLLLFLIGVGYELFEYYIGTTNNALKQLGPVSSDNDQSWWYGRYSDILFNTLGIITGAYLSPYRI